MITLRPATESDRAFLFALRNDPAVRRQSTTTRPVRAAAHARWMAETLRGGARRCFVVEHRKSAVRVGASDDPVPGAFGRPLSIGYVRLDWSATHGRRRAVVSVALIESVRGVGLGQRMLARLTTEAKTLKLTQLEANVRTGNPASLVIFLKAGYRIIRADRAWVTLRREV